MAKARILEIKARGAIVLLMETNEKAWLPSYEISTQYNHAKKLTEQALCVKGQELDVEIYGKELGGDKKLVSHIRFSNDPWKKVKTWQDTDAKEMKIDSVTTNHAFGMIEPGIGGFVVLADIYQNISFPPSWHQFKTICAGDIIAGYVKTGEIDQQNRLIKLEPTEYVKVLTDIPEFLPIIQKGLNISPEPKETGIWEYRQRKNHIFSDIRHILVVDNDHLFLKEMGDYLESCGIKITRARSLSEVKHFLDNSACPDVEIALLDINLTKDHDYLGFQAAKAILRCQPRCRIIMTSGDSIDINKIASVAGNLPISGFLYKPFGIEDWNLSLSCALRENPTNLSNFFNQTLREAELPLTVASKTQTLHKLISDLRKEIKADVVALFGIHPLTYNVKIEAYSGAMKGLLEEYLEKLRYSPVKDVAIDKESIIAGKITCTSKSSKHRWLYSALHYESCIAYPIPITSDLEYCIFVFHALENFFTEIDSYKVGLTAERIAQAMEIERLEKTIRMENPFYLAGKTYGSMAHDLSNTLSREFGISNILKTIDTQTVIAGEDKLKIKEDLELLNAELQRAREILHTFRRMSRSQHEVETEVNVKDILQKVAENIKIETDALNTEINVVFPPESTTPPAIVKIKQTAFEQVLFNLFLNAAQQIKRFDFARGKGKILAEYSIINDEEGKNSLRLLVHDSGPGIHGQDFEKVFEKGYTTKENGSGMGLDICRNILDQAGGKIHVLKSILFCGTTFEILLPLYKKEE